jgi:hypothetical protein
MKSDLIKDIYIDVEILYNSNMIASRKEWEALVRLRETVKELIEELENESEHRPIS